MKSTAKVGMLLVVFVVLIFASFGVLGRSLLGTPVDTYFAELPDAGGITPGTRVLMAGVRVGTVSKIDLVGPSQAHLTLTLTKGVAVPEGSRIVIPGSLIGLGDTPVNLVPPAQIAGTAAPGTTFEGVKAGPLDSVFPDGGQTAYREATRTLVAVRKLLEDQKLQGNVQALMKQTNETLKMSQVTLKNFAALANRGTLLLDRNQANIDGIVATTRATLEDVHTSATTIAKLLKEGKFQNEALALMEKANKIATQSSGLLASFDRTINDPQLQKDLRTVASNAAATSERGPAVADNAQKITENMALITERSKDLPLKLGELADKASKLESQLSDLLEKVTGIVGKRPSTSPVAGLTTQIDLMRQTNPGYWRTDLTASLPLSDGFINFGLWDAFESNKVTAQVGKHASPALDYRYGIYASKPGLGVDYRLGPKLTLRNDVWDINSLRFDSRLRYEFGNGLIGWVGVDKIFHDNTATIGLGIRR